MISLLLLTVLTADPIGDLVADAGVHDAGPASLCKHELPADTSPQVRFSPHGGCTQLVVDVISEAHCSLRLAAYDFTSQPVTDALVAAHKRGVDVEVILDKRANLTNKHSGLLELEDAGIETLIDGAHPIFHDKYIVVDLETLELGSFNYSAQAEKNGENCLRLVDPNLAQQYAKDWISHAVHAKLPDGGPSGRWPAAEEP